MTPLATRGRPIPAATIKRIRELCAVCRVSLRRTAREVDVALSTVQKYRHFSETPPARTSAGGK